VGVGGRLAAPVLVEGLLGAHTVADILRQADRDYTQAGVEVGAEAALLAAAVDESVVEAAEGCVFVVAAKEHRAALHNRNLRKVHFVQLVDAGPGEDSIECCKGRRSGVVRAAAAELQQPSKRNNLVELVEEVAVQEEAVVAVVYKMAEERMDSCS
jgi:hypothetical protein